MMIQFIRIFLFSGKLSKLSQITGFLFEGVSFLLYFIDFKKDLRHIDKSITTPKSKGW